MFALTTALVAKIAIAFFVILLAVNGLMHLSSIRIGKFRAGDFVIVFLFCGIILANSRYLVRIAAVIPGSVDDVLFHSKQGASQTAATAEEFSDYVRWKTQEAVINEVGKTMPGVDLTSVRKILKDGVTSESLEDHLQLPTLEPQ